MVGGNNTSLGVGSRKCGRLEKQTGGMHFSVGVTRGERTDRKKKYYE